MVQTEQLSSKAKNRLFWACFIALTATSFIFMLRAMFISEWAIEFNLSKTQMGEILGAGLWPFAITIVLFSLIVDKIGFGKAMLFAFVCHISSTLLIIFANGYWMLYTGALIMALGNGTVEAVINPVVAALYPREKTKRLNILHAGWPGGMVIGGILALLIGHQLTWQFKMALIFIPVLLYGLLLIRSKFPVSERVAAGVSYIDMLKEVGFIGALIIVSLIVLQVGELFGSPVWLNILISFAIAGFYGYKVKSAGKALFIFLLIIILPLATTELATDSWLQDLMSPEMKRLGIEVAWIMIYVQGLMMVMRFLAGVMIKKMSPLMLLALSSLFTGIGILLLSSNISILIFIAATVYGIAKAYLYPTMIGVVGERFPKGGALTMNLLIGIGLVGSGVLGAPFFGYIQDTSIEKTLISYDQANQTQFHQTYVTDPRQCIFGSYYSIDNQKLSQASESEKQKIDEMQNFAKKDALKTIVLLPLFMLLCYIFLIFYFRAKGGYKQIEL